MKRILIVTLLLTAFAGVLYSNNWQDDMKEINKGPKYEKQWQEVDKHIQKNLPQSALKVIDEIYARAKADKNSEQVVKALIYKLRMDNSYQEDPQAGQIYVLEDELKKSTFPEKNVLASMLAQSYWQYYQNNRWSIMERTTVEEPDLSDVRTWDAKQFVERTIELYQTSLDKSDGLKKLHVAVFDEVINKQKDSRTFRPTLFDFLGHRAVDFYMNSESGLTRPAEQFHLNSETMLADAATFAKEEISSPEENALHFHALTLLQDLIRFHLNDKSPEALVDVDLKRLKFVKTNGIMPNKDAEYLKALEKLEQNYINQPISAEVTYEIAQHYFSESSNYSPDTEAHKWDRKTAFDILQKAIDRFPGSSHVHNCKVLQDQIKAKQLSMEMEQVNLPNAPFRALVRYQNVPKVYLKIMSLTPEELQQKRDSGERLNQEGWIKWYLSKTVAASWTVELPDDGDYHSHSVEIVMPELKNGFYIVLMGTTPEFSLDREAVATSPVWASRFGMIQKSSQKDKHRFIIVDRDSGKPLPGITAKLWKQNYNQKKRQNEMVLHSTKKTDRNGEFTVKAGSRADRFRIDLQGNNDRLFLDDFYNNSKRYRGGNNRRYTSTHFFTDRSIYRPGQTVFFKGIVIDYTDQQPNIAKKRSSTVQLFDVNHQKVSELQLQTNEYGTFSGQFVLPSSGLNGQMHIRNENGNVYFSMEEYKRPRFEVTFNPIEGSFRLDDKVSVSGKATAYAGANIDNADVTYRVVRQASFPYYRYWWKPMPSSPSVEILNGTTKTDATGRFEIDFTALADQTLDKEDKPVFSYTVYADVIDISGETRSATAGVRVGYVALDVQVNVPSTVNRNSMPEWDITTKNLNGEFEAANGDITIHQLDGPHRVLRPRFWQRPDRFLITKDAYVKDFPNDIYDREDDYRSWESGKRYLSQKFDTDRYKKLRLEKLSAWPEGHYVVELNTRDAFGESINVKRYFTLYDMKKDDIPGMQFNWQAAEKLSGEPGETASYAWGSAAKDLHALVEVYKRDGIAESRWERGNGKNLLKMPITEKDRGGFGFSATWIRHGRLVQISQNVNVPWSNKELQISYETFRDKLKPGQEEEWRLKLSGPKGEKLAAEMLAGMYDASLDAFAPHSWNFSVFSNFSFPYHLRQVNSGSNFSSRSVSANGRNWNYYPGMHHRTYDQLDFYPGASMFGYGGGRSRMMRKSSAAIGNAQAPEMLMESAAPTEADFSDADAVMVTAQAAPPVPAKPEAEAKSREEAPVDSNSGSGEPQVRKNLNETAFFFPHLKTNAEGEIILSFTVPEALTRWKLLGFAHTKNLEYGMTQNEIVTQKELMVLPNAPRFMRDGDKMTFAAKVSNLSEKALSGTAELQLFDAVSMKPIDNLFKNKTTTINFSAPAGQSDALMWEIEVPADIDAVTYRVIARAGNFSDGEENTLPVLTNRMLVTEALPLPIRGKGTTEFKLEKLVNNDSKTLRHKRLTLEFTSNPAWYAIQALPYLMEYPYECSEQIFSRYYANSIASHIANSSPKIKRVFDSWKQSGDALVSNLEKNQELKNLLLEETPWVLQAQDETERKKRVGLLFDLNTMSRQLETAKRKLQQMQLPSGAWPWFTDMRANRYLTQHIVAGFGHLDKLEVTSDNETRSMAQRALQYMDEEMYRDYRRMLEDEVDIKKNRLSSLIIHYLYARSYFMNYPVRNDHLEAFNYWKSQAQQYWVELGQVYREGMVALALHRLDDKKTPTDIIASLKERALHSEEMGMYWRSETGYFWYQAPIETQALLIELFDEVTNDRQAVNDMRIWLLKQKQTQDWKTTKATVEACYALLLRGTDWLADDRIVEVSLGGEKVDIAAKDDTKPEAGTGYFKTAWTGSDIRQDMGNVSVTKQTEGVAWGGLYWQYFEDLDKITPHETPLKLKKELFLETPSATGPVLTKLDKQMLKPGDLLKVRIELRVDRTMEYVHMKDMRAAGLEPINVLSQYKYQGGLGYYESTKDASTNFFFGWLPKGTYVFEYPLRVTHEGNFSNGITTIQCMYAPEFTSHSEGIRIAVGK